MKPRIHLSAPHVAKDEVDLIKDAVAPETFSLLCPHIDAFEHEFARALGIGHAAAVSSGTAAIHLALRLLRIQPGDRVLCPTLTSCATANPILREGARQVFLDVQRGDWTLDPQLLLDELRGCPPCDMPRALIAVDLYGQSADYRSILEICERYDIPVIEDAAEALGATYLGKSVGGFGRCAAFSFAGNKMITTFGGGMLVSDDADLIDRARFLSSQPVHRFDHGGRSSIGYNHRMSNVLAAIGRGQLRCLDARVAARRRIAAHYRRCLAHLPGITLLPKSPLTESSAWLTCIVVDPRQFGATRDDIHLALEAANIEARLVWKPLHLQPAFADCPVRGGAIARSISERGLCLPSGSAMGFAEVDRVVSVILDMAGERNVTPAEVEPALTASR